MTGVAPSRRPAPVTGETVAEYLARGGIITQVPVGVSGLPDGGVMPFWLDGSPGTNPEYEALASAKPEWSRGGWRR